jgi:hypothetical protein
MRRITAPKSPRSVGRFDAKLATMDAMSEAAAREQKRVALVVHYADGSSQTWLQVGYRAKDAFIRAEGEWQDAFEWLSQEASAVANWLYDLQAINIRSRLFGLERQGRQWQYAERVAHKVHGGPGRQADSPNPSGSGRVDREQRDGDEARPKGFRAEEGLARKVGDVVDEES